VTMAEKVIAFNPSLTPAVAARMEHDAVLDLLIEAEARRAHDPQLAATGANGDVVAVFTDPGSQDASSGRSVQTTYSFDRASLDLWLPKFSTQASRLVGVTLHGTATFTVRDARGQQLSQTTSPYQKSWGLSGIGPGDHQLIVADYTDLSPA
jgi:hypothetical protein